MSEPKSLGFHAAQLRAKFGTTPTGEILQQPTEIEAPVSDKMRAYVARVFAERPQAPPPSPSFVQNESFDDARQRFGKLWKENLARVRLVKNKPDYQVNYNEEQQEVVRHLIRYFINDPDCKWPLHKGLFVSGPPGTGKTELMRVIAEFAKDGPKAFVFTNFENEMTRARENDDYAVTAALSGQNRALDECGYGDPILKRYGNVENVLESVLYQRAQRHERFGQFTHVISNLSPSDFKKVVDERISDRARAMFTPVLFTGNSQRQ